MIRLLRILEYTFKDGDVAAANIGHFAIPMNGSHDFGNVQIYSACIIDFSPQDATDVVQDGLRYREIMEAVERSSLASDGFEMIEAAMRGD